MKKLKSLHYQLFLLAGLVLAISQACNNVQVTDTGLYLDTLELADQKMQAYIDEGKLPCISTLIIKDGKVAHRGLFGLANIEEERAVNENTIFRMYSMSKPITAAALMILYDEGKFQLDDPVANYIPEFEGVKVWVDGSEVAQDTPFTIRHLLTHTAGFTYGWDQNAYVDSLYRDMQKQTIWASATLKDMIMFLTTVPLKYQPGTKYEYSVSIDVAGYLVEVLSGQTFDVFLEERMFGPLGMADAGFEVPEVDHNRLAMIYSPDRESGKLAPVEEMTNGVKKDVTLFSGGGGMVATIGDYAKFGQMLLNGGELDGVRILEESTVKLITTNQMNPPANFENIGYGLGGYVNEEEGRYGWSGAASTDFVLDMKNNMVILTLTQYTPFMGEPFKDEFNELVKKALSVER